MNKLALFLVVLSMASAVHGLTVGPQTHTGTLTESSTTDSFTFNVFDSSLGTLNSVDITLTVSTISLQPRANNVDVTSHTLSNLNAAISGKLRTFNTAGNTLFDITTFAGSFDTDNVGGISQVIAAGNSFTMSTQTAAGGSQTTHLTSPTDTVDYQSGGTAGGATLTVTVALTSSAGGGASDTATGLSYGIASVTLPYTATITYTYTATVTGDPQFVGFQGQHFQIHGTPDEHYSLISSANYYVNSRFVYMATGSCNYNDTECFSHPGTYIGALGFVAGENRIKIVAGSHAQGLTVLVNDKLASPATKIHFDNDTYLHVISHSRVTLAAYDLKLSVVNSDMFVNLGAEFTNGPLLHAGHQLVAIPASASAADADKMISTAYPEHLLHGLLGQTWRNIQWPQRRMYQGEPADYLVSDMFSPEFVFNQYSA